MDDQSLLNPKKEDILIDTAEFFKIFGDSTRIKLLYVLLQSSSCVNELAQSVGMNQSAVSHQLRILKQAKLIKGTRRGKTVVYELADEHVATILKQGIDHVQE